MSRFGGILSTCVLINTARFSGKCPVFSLVVLDSVGVSICDSSGGGQCPLVLELSIDSVGVSICDSSGGGQCPLVLELSTPGCSVFNMIVLLPWALSTPDAPIR